MQPGVNPDDPGCAPQGKTSQESSGDALGAVMMKDLQVNCTAGETEHYEDPSLELGVVLGGQDRSKDISLAVGEMRLNGLEDVRYIVQFDAARAGFLQTGDHLPDSREEELGLDVAEDLEDVPTMTHFDVCVLHDTFFRDGFLANQGDPDPGSKAAI